MSVLQIYFLTRYSKKTAFKFGSNCHYSPLELTAFNIFNICPSYLYTNTWSKILTYRKRVKIQMQLQNYLQQIYELVRRPKLNVCSNFPYYFAHHLLELGLFHWHLNRQTKFMCLFVCTLCINFCANCYSYVFSVFLH